MFKNVRINPWFRGILTVVLVLIFQSLLMAESGKISGRVYNQSTGEALPGANVIIETKWISGKEVELTEKQGSSCDADGFYFILNVSPGIYNIKASMMGYTPLLQTQVQVNIDRTISLDFALSETVLEMAAVEVTAHQEIIRPDVSGTQEIITTERISEAPVMRIDEFVNNIKGVELVASEEGHGLSIRGGGIRETDVRIDGISARDPRSENSYLSLNSTSVAELQVLTGGFEAKYGGFRSGLVNVVTKEGSRKKYAISIKADYTPSSSRKFFGDNPWSPDFWAYKVFADTTFGYIDPSDGTFKSFAMDGVPEADSLLPEDFPAEFRSFKGWNAMDRRTKKPLEGTKNYAPIGLPDTAVLTPEQRRQLWMLQHPFYEYADKPDTYVEGTITGPLPGKWLPLLGDWIERTTFLLAGKYENTQFAFPIGPRQNYLDYNTQIKLTSNLNSKAKLTLNFLYARVETNTADRPTSFGGSLMDYSSRFSFLSSTQQSTEQQARILGSGSGYINMFNKTRLQYLDQRWFMGGVKFNHAFSSRAYQTLDIQFSYHDNEINSFRADTSSTSAWVALDSSVSVLDYPNIGTPNSSTNWAKDITDLFIIYGGLQQADSSFSWALDLKYNLTAQLGRFHQLEAGVNFRYALTRVNTGTWYQSEKMWTPGVPDSWQYYTVKPIELGIYLQDKLEFEGMIANVGLRADYFNANRNAYLVQHPIDPAYANFYNLVYEYLPGKWGSWERWEVFRDMLSDPPDWPEKKYKAQLKLSPRLGVSFPVTIKSKLYFNYGHFYQRPNLTYLYNIGISASHTIVPSTDLDMARTVSYEFGYEQRFFQSFLFNVSFYYKDVKNEPLSRTFVDYWEEYSISRYYPDSFADTRGVELRLERNLGRFFTFWANYEYMLQSWGQTGLATVYENRITAREEERSPNIWTTEPQPRAHINLNLHIPYKWGPRLLGIRPLSGMFVNLLFDWRDGGRIVILQDPLTGQQKKAEVVDYTNLDLRASKLFDLKGVGVEIVLTVTNVLNQKRLYISGMSTAQYNRYKDSLHFPFEEGDEHGNDKWGEWDKEHIDLGWFKTPLFLNPRRILLGIRLNF
jgi:hypothetical protein